MNNTHDYDAIWRGSGTTLWRAVYAYAGGRRDVADDAVAEAFARVMARGAEVREPLPYLYRVAFRVASAELARSGKEAAEMPEIPTADPTQNGLPDLMRALRELRPPSEPPCISTTEPNASARGRASHRHVGRLGEGASDARSPSLGAAPRRGGRRMTERWRKKLEGLDRRVAERRRLRAGEAGPVASR